MGKKKTGKKKWLCAACALVCAGVFCMLLFFWRQAAYAPVITINGVAVETDEIRMYIQDERAAISSWFYQNYQADSSEEGFWQKEYDGVTPAEKLGEEVVSELTEEKTRQILLAENGFAETFSFAELLNMMEEENESRSEALENGEVIYGNTEFTIENYYSWYYSQGLTELKEKFRQEFDDYTEDDLKEAYEEYGPYTGQVSGKLCFYVTDESLPEGTDEQLFSDVSRYFEEGRTEEETVLMADEYYHVSITVREEDVSEEEVGKEDTVYEAVISALREMEEGEVSALMDFGEAYGVFQVLEKEGGEAQSFEDVREAVLYQYTEEAFEEYLSREAENAEVKIREKKLRKLIESELE